MSCSAKQLAANRRNAKKSTGPRTSAGKAISSQNAVKHGLYAKSAILDTPALKEDRHEYLSLVDSLVDEMRPVGRTQLALVRQVARSLWLQKRLLKAELRVVASSDTTTTCEDPDLALVMSRFTRDLLSREHALDRILTESIDQIYRLRSRRPAPETGQKTKLTTTNPFQNRHCKS